MNGKERKQKKQVNQQLQEDTKKQGMQQYEVERVMEKKKELGTGIWLYKVRWVGYTSDDDTWEPIESIIHLKEALQDMKKREGEKTRAEKVQDKITEAFSLSGKKRNKQKRKVEGVTPGTHSMVLRPRTMDAPTKQTAQAETGEEE